jgi:hypothetical protein
VFFKDPGKLTSSMNVEVKLTRSISNPLASFCFKNEGMVCDIMKNPGTQWALKMMHKSVMLIFHPCPYEVSEHFSFMLSTEIETLRSSLNNFIFQGLVNVSGLKVRTMMTIFPFGVFNNRIRFYDDLDANGFSLNVTATNKPKLT